MSTSWTTQDIPRQDGKRCIITGANSGIGFHTALELAKAGAEVTIVSRHEEKGAAAARRIMATVPRAALRTGLMDLADPASVERFTNTELAEGRPIDILIKNAGVMALPKRETSPDGHELQFATNVLGPFRLTGMLLPLLLRATVPKL